MVTRSREDTLRPIDGRFFRSTLHVGHAVLSEIQWIVEFVPECE